MDRKVHRVWKAFKASKVIPALKGRKVQWVRKDRKVFRAIRVRPGRKGCKVIPARLVHKGRGEILVPKVRKDCKVNKDSKARPAIHTGR